MLVQQSVPGALAGPSDLRALNLMTAMILLLMALGAILLARRVSGRPGRGALSGPGTWPARLPPSRH